MAHKGAPLSLRAYVKKALKQISANKKTPPSVKVEAIKILLTIESRELARLPWAYEAHTLLPSKSPTLPVVETPPAANPGLTKMQQQLENLRRQPDELPKD